MRSQSPARWARRSRLTLIRSFLIPPGCPSMRTAALRFPGGRHSLNMLFAPFSPRDLSIQAFSLYRMRFVFSADLRKAWRACGCLGPQLPHFSTVLHISVTESVGSALPYRRLVNLKIQEKNRARPTQASDFVTILAVVPPPPPPPPLKGQDKREYLWPSKLTNGQGADRKRVRERAIAAQTSKLWGIRPLETATWRIYPSIAVVLAPSKHCS